MHYQRVDKYLLAHTNKQNVFHCIMNDGPINKSAIAQRVGLTIPSVMKIVDSLEENGLTRSLGKGASSGGKPPEMLEVVPDAHYAVGVDIGLSHIRIVIGNMKKNIIAKYEMSSPKDASAEEMADLLAEKIEQIIDDSGIDRSRLLGIGVGAPGLIDNNGGKIVFSPHFRWENVDLRSALESRVHYPVYIDNVTKDIARAEYDLGAGRGAKYVFNLNLGRGIASALVIQGDVYYGENGLCGEIGHLTVNREGPLCMCGNYGCLEAMASGAAIAQQARDFESRGASSKMLEMADGEIENIDAKLVFDACKAGDQPARIIIERALEYIGIAVAGVINLLDVDRVVINGGMTKNGDLFWEMIKANITKHLMKYSGTTVDIVPAALGDEAAAVGAVCHVIQQFLITL